MNQQLANLLNNPISLGILAVIIYLGIKFLDALFNFWFKRTVNKDFVDQNKCSSFRSKYDDDRKEEMKWLKTRMANLERVIFHIGLKMHVDEEVLNKLLSGGFVNASSGEESNK